MPLSAAPSAPSAFADVLGSRMAYVTSGDDIDAGDPIVFIHGNPTSSYLWRNVMPHLEGLGRLIAPDLIGMGASDKLADPGPDRYTLVEHRRYLDALLGRLGVERSGPGSASLSEAPMPIRSGAISRPRPSRWGITLRHRYDEVGLPWMNTIGSPASPSSPEVT